MPQVTGPIKVILNHLVTTVRDLTSAQPGCAASWKTRRAEWIPNCGNKYWRVWRHLVAIISKRPVRDTWSLTALWVTPLTQQYTVYKALENHISSVLRRHRLRHPRAHLARLTVTKVQCWESLETLPAVFIQQWNFQQNLQLDTQAPWNATVFRFGGHGFQTHKTDKFNLLGSGISNSTRITEFYPTCSSRRRKG